MFSKECALCGCELGKESLNKTTSLLFNKSMCMKWHNYTLSMVYVQYYYKEHGTLDGCYDYLITNYADQIDRATNRFHDYAKNSTNLTWEQHRDIVVHHFACESIEGYQIEIDVMNKIKQILPDVTFKHTNIDMDLKYAVDFFVMKDGKPLCGIQAKGISWYYWIVAGSGHSKMASSSTDRKWENFKKDYKRPNLPMLTVMIENNEFVALKNNENLEKINIRNVI